MLTIVNLVIGIWSNKTYKKIIPVPGIEPGPPG